jgi:ABC-type siderophore export system fused ATPase/permease subunit
MDHFKKLSKIVVFLILVAGAVVFTYLTVYSLSFVMNAVGPVSPLLMGLCTVLLTIFTCALVIFVCALYLLVIVGGFVELNDRLHFHKIVQRHRELDLQKHRREVLLGDHHPITSDLSLPRSEQRVTGPRIRRIDRRDWTRP